MSLLLQNRMFHKNQNNKYGSSFFQLIIFGLFAILLGFLIFNSRCSEAVIITGGHLLEDSKLAKLLLICVKNN